MAVIRPFVPAQDFEKSCAFYSALGFKLSYHDETLAIFDYEDCGFLLQNFYVKDFAENCMLQFFVADLDSWWERTTDLVARFSVAEPRAPSMQPWGIRVGFVFDPSGVLWQIAEAPKK